MRSSRTASGTGGDRPAAGADDQRLGAVARWQRRRQTVPRSEGYHRDGVAVVKRAGGALQLRVREVIVGVFPVCLLQRTVIILRQQET